MQAMVLAAGRGSRLQSETGGTPKPLVEVGGKPVLVNNLEWLARFGITEVTINVHHRADAIQAAIGEDDPRWGMRIRWSREEILRGTAGALVPVRDVFSEAPFLVVYGDNWFDFDLEQLIAAHRESAAIATLALYSVAVHEHTGIAGGRVEMDRSGRVLRFVEGRDDTGLELVNAGCYVVEPDLLQHIPEPAGPGGRPFDFGHDLFPFVLGHGGILGGHRIDGRCLAVDTPDALRRARSILAGSCA